jgi:kynurenine formamidase
MCYICVMNRVKERMLSRRDLFRVLAAGAAAAALGNSVVAPPALAAGHGSVRDLTHTFDADFPTWDGAPGTSIDKRANFASDGYNLFNLTVNEHAGTHIDAPLHFSADGASVDELEIGNLVCPLCIVNIADRAAEDADTMVTTDDLSAWISANGDIPDRACVAMYSGWAEMAPGDGFRNADGDGVQHYPGFHVEAAHMLMEQTGAASIAVDTLSLDQGASQDFATHYAWLPSGRYGIECVAGLGDLPATGATLIVGAPKHRGGTGGQARIFALL